MGLLLTEFLYQRSRLLKLTYRRRVNPHAALQALHLSYMLRGERCALPLHQRARFLMPEECGYTNY